MGIRDIATKFEATPVGHGCYRDLTGAYNYITDSQNLEANFSMVEFNTEGIHPYGIMLKLANQLQAMRTALGVPVYITSGYRNPPTGEVGNNPSLVCWNEPHADGLAADISVPQASYLQVAQAAYNAGFTRIEVIKAIGQKYTDHMNGGHVHVDVYDGSGNTTAGTMYDSPASSGIPFYPWYAYGVQSDNDYTSVESWEALLSILETQ